MHKTLLSTFGLLLALAPLGHAQSRLKDIAVVQGVRGNQLVGYGLVVGLEGTGDGTGASFTPQSVASLLQKFGVTVPPGALKAQECRCRHGHREPPRVCAQRQHGRCDSQQPGRRQVIAGRHPAADTFAGRQWAGLCRRAGRDLGGRISDRRRAQGRSARTMSRRAVSRAGHWWSRMCRRHLRACPITRCW